MVRINHHRTSINSRIPTYIHKHFNLPDHSITNLKQCFPQHYKNWALRPDWKIQKMGVYNIIAHAGCLWIINYLSFQAEKYHLVLMVQSTSCWEIPYWPKVFQVLLYKQHITVHSVNHASCILRVWILPCGKHCKGTTDRQTMHTPTITYRTSTPWKFLDKNTPNINTMRS